MRQEYLHLGRKFRVKETIIDYDIEEPFYHLSSSFDELLIFTERYFRFHESKKTVGREGWKDETSLLFGQNLNMKKCTSNIISN